MCFLWGEFTVDYRKNLKENKFSIFICDSRRHKMHSHDFLELAYVLKGSASHTLDDNTMKISEGDFFVVNYRSQHSYYALTEEFELINCLFLPELIDSSLINCRSLSTLISNYQIHFNQDLFTINPSSNIYQDGDGAVGRILFDMLREFEEKAPGYMQVIRSKIIELLIVTMRKIYFTNTADTQNDIDTILKYISTEYMNDLTLGDICKKFNYSFAYLSAKFKNEVGINFTQYLQKIRIEQSMRLLANTDKTIIEIAQEVGYNDIKAFYIIFKRIANTTPAKFRRSYYRDL